MAEVENRWGDDFQRKMGLQRMVTTALGYPAAEDVLKNPSYLGHLGQVSLADYSGESRGKMIRLLV